MVAFNPELPPEPAPNYTSYMYEGRAIPEPKPNLSKGIGYEALGDLAKGVATTVDNFTKAQIDTQIHNRVDAETNQYISSLNAIRESKGELEPSQAGQADRLGTRGDASQVPAIAVGTGEKPTGSTDKPVPAGTNSTGAAAPYILPPETKPAAPPPAAVDKGIDQANKIKMAQAQNSGKVSDTYYRGQLFGITQALRAQFPGYRDYIDEKLGNTANQYMRAIIDEMNENASKKDTTAEFAHHKAIEAAYKFSESGDSRGAGIVAAATDPRNRNGEYDSNIMDFINQAHHTDWVYAQQTKEAEALKAQGATEEYRMTGAVKDLMHNWFHDNWDAMSKVYGLLPEDKFREIMMEHAKDPSKYTEVIAQQTMLRTQALNKMEAALKEKLHEGYKKTDGTYLFTDEHGPMTTYKPDQLQAWINEAKAPYEMINRLFSEKDPVLATFYQELNAQIKQGNIYKLQHDPVLGEALQKIDALHGQNMPPEVLADIGRKLFWAPGASGTVDYFMKMHLLNALVGTKTSDGHYTTPSGYFDSEIANGTAMKDMSKNMALILNSVPSVASTDMNDQNKANFYHGWMDPNNHILDEKYLAKDFYDDSTKKWVPGKIFAFNKILNPATLADIHRLDQNGTAPGLWKETGDWMVDNFRQQLFSREIGDLKDLANTDWLKVKYDTTTHQFSVYTTGAGDPVAPGQYTNTERLFKMRPQVAQSIARLNGALKAVGNFSKEDGNWDVNAFLMQTLIHSGEGVPQKLLDAVKSGAPAPANSPEKAKNSTKQGSLEDAIKNELASNSPNTPVTGSIGHQNLMRLASAESGMITNDANGGDMGSLIKNAMIDPTSRTALPGNNRLSLEDVADKGVQSRVGRQEMNPTFRTNMENAINDYTEETGHTPHISSLVRDRELQAKYYHAFITGQGGRAARPGLSLHEYGAAADLNSDPRFANWLKANGRAKKYGVEFLNKADDPYHVQLAKDIRAKLGGFPY